MRSEVKGQIADTKSQIDGQAGPELEALRSEAEPKVPEGLEARIAQLVRNRPRAASRALPRMLVRVAAVVLILAGVWLGTKLGDGICGGQADRHAQMLAEEGL